MYRILNGIGNIDNFLTTFDGVPFEGMTVRLFNPKTKLWSLYWADSNEGKFDQPAIQVLYIKTNVLVDISLKKIEKMFVCGASL